MKITYKDKKIEVTKVEGFSSLANIMGCGKRKLYEDKEKQAYVKCFGKWWQFPQDIEY